MGRDAGRAEKFFTRVAEHDERPRVKLVNLPLGIDNKNSVWRRVKDNPKVAERAKVRRQRPVLARWCRVVGHRLEA
jgi:hypothetical protein